MRIFKGKNLFRSLFASSRNDRFLVSYVLREHARGRPLAEIFEDPYLRNRSTPEQRARLLDAPEVVAAIGRNAVSGLRPARPTAS
jgi:hypothetical protein